MTVPTTSPIFETDLEGLEIHRRGKVRDLYHSGEHLLIITTDRISAYDLVLGSTIPDKGKVLTQLSAFWFNRTTELVPNHMLSINTKDYGASLQANSELLEGRSMLVRQTKPIPIECVVRGFLAGSGWREYSESGQVCGIKLKEGLRESEKLAEPIFTPATKAETGHDINISEADASELIGRELVEKLRELSLAIYSHGAAHAEERGILVADTKFEFGLSLDEKDQKIILIDEVLTPDSSRFWPKKDYIPGQAQSSFDKQFVRDYLDSINWNRKAPVPELPEEVIHKTRDKYLEAFSLLTGETLA